MLYTDITIDFFVEYLPEDSRKRPKHVDLQHAVYRKKVKQSRYRPGVAQRVPGS
jgi:hypothetical protein